MSRPPDAPLSEELQYALATASFEERASAEQWLRERKQCCTLAALATAIVQERNRVASAPKKALRAKAWQERKDAFYQGLRSNEEQIGYRVARLVERCRKEVGKAPTWSEVGRVMGWDLYEHIWAIRWLIKRGWLEATEYEARSLRPGPRYGSSRGLPAEGRQRDGQTVRSPHLTYRLQFPEPELRSSKPSGSR